MCGAAAQSKGAEKKGSKMKDLWIRPLRKLWQKPFTVLLFVTILISTVATTQIHAATNYVVPLRTDGQTCADIGDVSGLYRETGPAGTTYFANGEGETIQSPLNVEAPFAIAMYDADGSPTTALVLMNSGAAIWHHGFKTKNNSWSKTFTITVPVDAFTLTLPDAHASTHLCLIQPPSSEATTTPTNTPTAATPVATSEPTNTPVSLVADLSINANIAGYQEPSTIDTAPKAIYRAVIDDVPYVTIGSTVIMTIAVRNSGNTLAKNVVLYVVTDNVTVTVHVGDIRSGAATVTQYLATATEGLTIATITAATTSQETARLNNRQSVIWVGVSCIDNVVDEDTTLVYKFECSNGASTNQVFLPLVKR